MTRQRLEFGYGVIKIEMSNCLEHSLPDSRGYDGSGN